MMYNLNQKVKLGYIGSVNGAVDEIAAINLLKNNTPDTTKDVDMVTRNYFKYTVNDDYYYVFKNHNGIDIYKALPLVNITEEYQWKPRTFRNGIRMLCCQVEYGNIYFYISVNLKTNNASITPGRIVGNQHKPIDHIVLRESPTNEDISKAIDEWLNDYFNEMASIRNCYKTKKGEFNE